MIEIKNFTKIYNESKKAVDNLSFTVNDGEIFAFIGHNGAGKTTTLRSMVGILEFEDGEILINGKNIKTNPIECKMDMAYVPDNPTLYENMKAIDYIKFICSMYNTPIEVMNKNVKEYSEIFEIENNLNDEISSFSHGMKQKIALIAALSHDPKILIMDEPFVGLDPKAVFNMKQIMEKMIKDKKTVIFSTHILDVAEKLCTNVLIINQGKLVISGKMKDITKNNSLEKIFLDME